MSEELEANECVAVKENIDIEFNCSDCHLGFKFEIFLQEHMRIHEDARQKELEYFQSFHLECDACDVRILSKQQLIQHSGENRICITKVQQENYPSFRDSENEEAKGKGPPPKCIICLEEYVDLTNHFKEKHSTMVEEINKKIGAEFTIRKAQCPFCKKTFSSKPSSLKQHLTDAACSKLKEKGLSKPNNPKEIDALLLVVNDMYKEISANETITQSL